MSTTVSDTGSVPPGYACEDGAGDGPGVGVGVVSAAVDPGDGAARPGAVTRRASLCFTPDGRRAAGLAGDATGRMWAELWSFDGESARLRALPTATGETLRTQLVPTPDGRVLVLRNGLAEHRLALLGADGAEVLEHPLATVRARGARLLVSPDPEVPGFLATVDAAGSLPVRRLWRIGTGPGGGLSQVHCTETEFTGGVWLDGTGRRLAVSLRRDGRVVPGVLDLTTGTLAEDEQLARPADGGPWHLLLAAGAGGWRVLTAGPAGAPRYALSRAGGGAHLPERWSELPGTVRPLAFDPAGRRIALNVEAGARSRVWSHDLDHDSLTEIPVPAGVVRGPAHWGPAGLRFPYSAPDLPTGLALLGTGGGWTLTGSRPHGATAHTERVPGAEGPIEAVVYGGPDWWRSPRLVIAVHGGPQEHWDLGHQPFLQGLVAEGAAVLAPNQRGSTGYGAAHRDVLDGAWGVPDLADLLHLGETLAARREPLGLETPALFGTSYGAYLTLLATGLRPGLWSRCAAVSPFLSAARLRGVAARPTRALLDRLHATREAEDATGPRDLARVFAGPARPDAPPLLLVHGRQDPVIPVGQSRELRRLLLDAGRTEGRDLHYRELPLGGHGPLDDGDPEAAATAVAVARFLTGTA
ncbi:alpha/beta fold hydrolase [Kitasatospora sp. NPDC051853]|uniref:S9 family peptidase n=1 Tax=Kitasatospora sp. NPDC051853 TaxID=3364058 RepID=UPI0037919220